VCVDALERKKTKRKERKITEGYSVEEKEEERIEVEMQEYGVE